MAEGNIHEEHRERVRQKVLQHGLDTLTDYEMLEYLLFFAIPRRDTSPLAHALINHFGGFAQVLDATEEELLGMQGVGPATARMLTSYVAVNRRYMQCKARGNRLLDTTEKQAACLLPLFHGVRDEQVYLLALDDRYRLLRAAKLAEGTVNTVLIDAQKAASVAMRAGATNVVLAHNHPGGCELPTADDLIATGTVMQKLDVLGILLLDHIIVAGGEYMSLRRTGRMPRLKEGKVEVDIFE